MKLLAMTHSKNLVLTNSLSGYKIKMSITYILYEMLPIECLRLLPYTVNDYQKEHPECIILLIGIQYKQSDTKIIYAMNFTFLTFVFDY